jgi:hypothetical protein
MVSLTAPEVVQHVLLGGALTQLHLQQAIRIVYSSNRVNEGLSLRVVSACHQPILKPAAQQQHGE